MRRAVARLGCIVLLGFSLSACTSLFAVHDPQSGLISSGQVPSFLKSLRCELITFYQLARLRKAAYIAAIRRGSLTAFDDFGYFDVAPEYYGAFTLELKVTDTAGIGTGTAFDFKRIVNATTSNVTHLGPTLGGQAIYDLIWSFALKQDASLSTRAEVSLSERAPLSEGSCFTLPVVDLPQTEFAAEHMPPQHTAFVRILVNGQKPLAAWLRDNGKVMGANNLSPAAGLEIAEPAQMYYLFSLQVAGGLEAKYTLTTVQLSPLAVQASASLQQNSYVQMYINGPLAAAANGAKSGQVKWVPPNPALGTSGNPIYIRSSGATTSNKENKETKDVPLPGEGRQKSTRKSFSTDRFQFIAPLPIAPPSASGP